MSIFFASPGACAWGPCRVRQQCRAVCARVTACSPSLAPVVLPTWEREYERGRGLVGTSYESATVDEVTQVGGGFLKIIVDMSVTCTALQYISSGQFLFLKPWGDEDGAIEPCCFTAPPGQGSSFEFYVPEDCAVGDAALSGEMLEVSEVMGKGLGAKLAADAFSSASEVIAFTGSQFCFPVLLSLAEERSRPVRVYAVASEDGPFVRQVSDWASADGAENRSAFLFESIEDMAAYIPTALQGASEPAIVLSGDSDLASAVCVALGDSPHRGAEVLTP